MLQLSQIIEKNLDRHRRCETGLWINPEKDSVWLKARDSCALLRLICQDFGAFEFHQQAGADVEFATIPDQAKQACQWIILNLPRQKALLGMLLEYAASRLAEDGVVWLAGENKAGIKSADKLLKGRFSVVNKLDSARHCTLYEAARPLNKTVFRLRSYQQQWVLEFRQEQIKLVSYPGVFAHGRLDGGTALLLDSLSNMDFSGDVLDFGCGTGVIGTCVAVCNQDARLTFLDSNALAIQACRETMAANKINGCVLPSNGLSAVTGRYDMVISNPPIHTGVKTDNRLGMRLLESVHQHIRPGGGLILVANRHLPYENWLSDNFRQVKEIAADHNFKVISATVRE